MYGCKYNHVTYKHTIFVSRFNEMLKYSRIRSVNC